MNTEMNCFSFWFYEQRSEHYTTSTEKRSNTLCSVSLNKVVVCLILKIRTWKQTNGHVYNKDNLLNFVVIEVTIKPHHNSSNLESNWKFSLSRLSKNAKGHGYAVKSNETELETEHTSLSCSIRNPGFSSIFLSPSSCNGQKKKLA